MDKLDYTKDLKQLYQPSARAVVQVVVPRLNYLMLDGRGDPNTSPAYQHAVETLLSRCFYGLKTARKSGQVRPTHRKNSAAPQRWWRTQQDPFAPAWPVVEGRWIRGP